MRFFTKQHQMLLWFNNRELTLPARCCWASSFSHFYKTAANVALVLATGSLRRLALLHQLKLAAHRLVCLRLFLQSERKLQRKPQDAGRKPICHSPRTDVRTFLRELTLPARCWNLPPLTRGALVGHVDAFSCCGAEAPAQDPRPKTAHAETTIPDPRPGITKGPSRPATGTCLACQHKMECFQSKRVDFCPASRVREHAVGEPRALARGEPNKCITLFFSAG